MTVFDRKGHQLAEGDEVFVWVKPDDEEAFIEHRLKVAEIEMRSTLLEPGFWVDCEYSDGLRSGHMSYQLEKVWPNDERAMR